MEYKAEFFALKVAVNQRKKGTIIINPPLQKEGFNIVVSSIKESINTFHNPQLPSY